MTQQGGNQPVVNQQRLQGSDREPYPIRVVQFGEGVFLRGFFDWMVHTYNQASAHSLSSGHQLGVALVQPRKSDGVVRLMETGGAYTLIRQGVRDGAAEEHREVIDCFETGVNTHTDPDGFTTLAHNPDVQVIVSNTTEAGLVFHNPDAALGLDQREAATSYPAKLVWFLYERFTTTATRDLPLVVLPMELVEDNGQVLRGLVLRLAEAWGLGAQFTGWLEETVEFADTLVDRIVTGFPGQDEADRLFTELGYRDPHLVVAELYHSLLVRGSQRIHQVLPFAQAGINFQVLDDLSAAREAKVGILNGTHTAMTPLGLLAGLDTVRETVEDAQIAEFLSVLQQRCILPSLRLDPAEAEAFVRDTEDRFRNPFIRHELLAISLNQTTKFQSRLVPVLQRIWEAGVAGAPGTAGGAADTWGTSSATEDSAATGAGTPGTGTGAAADTLGARGATGPVSPTGTDGPLALVVAALLVLHKTHAEQLNDDPDTLQRYAQLWAEHETGTLTTVGLVTQALADPVLFNLPQAPESFAHQVHQAVEIILHDGVRAAISHMLAEHQ